MFFGFRSLVVPCLVVSSQLSFSQDLPKDLSQLKTKYQKSLKSQYDNSIIDVEEYSSDTGWLLNLDAMMDSLAISYDDLKSLNYRKIDEDVRKQLLKVISTRLSKNSKVCQAFRMKELDLTTAGDLGEEEITKKRQRYYLSQCKEHMSKIFSGIMFADPETHVLEDVSNQNKKRLSVYVRSLVDDRFSLKFSFQLL